MSRASAGCPDWPSATAWRRGDGPAPAAWSSQLEHLAGCSACRRRLAAVDPTLLLAAAVPAPVIDEAESRQLAATVRAMLSSRRLAAGGRPNRRPLLAAAALLALLAVPLGLRHLWLPAAPVRSPAPAALGMIEEEPLVEEVLPAGARVYQFGSDELPVVLIVDENLDL